MSLCNASTKRVRWAFNIRAWQPNEPQFLLASSCIEEEEKARLANFAYKNDVKASLIGHLLMRKFISVASGTPYSEVKIGRGQSGRPYVVNCLVNFNLSHHGDYVVLAGEDVNIKVGVDILRLEHRAGREAGEFFRIMSRQFTLEEWAFVHGCRLATKQMIAFYRLWCLRESHLKARGLSLGHSRHYSFKTKETDLQIGTVTRGTRLYIGGTLTDDWCFEETLLDKDHCIAVALSRNVVKSNHDTDLDSQSLFQFLDFEQLMNGSEPILQPDVEYARNFFMKREQICRPLLSCLE